MANYERDSKRSYDKHAKHLKFRAGLVMDNQIY